MKLLFILLLTSIGGINLYSQAQQEKDLVRIKLISEFTVVEPGQSFNIALHMKMKKGWHTYWRNAGDSGLPTEIEWDLPEGLTAGEIQWPVPHKIAFDDLANYGYEDEVLLIIPFNVSKDVKLDQELEIKAKVSWLVCKEICISEGGKSSINISTGSMKKGYQHDAEIMEVWMPQYPKKWEGKISAKRNGDKIYITVHDGGSYQFFPYEGGIFNNGAEQKILPGDNWNQIEVLLDNFRIEEPKRMYGLLVGKDSAYEINVEITP